MTKRLTALLASTLLASTATIPLTIGPNQSAGASTSFAVVDPVIQYIADSDGVSIAAATDLAAFEGNGAKFEAVAREALGSAYVGLLFKKGVAIIRAKGPINLQLVSRLDSAFTSIGVPSSRVTPKFNSLYSDNELADIAARVSATISTIEPKAVYAVQPNVEDDGLTVQMPRPVSTATIATLTKSFPEIAISVQGVDPSLLPRTASCSTLPDLYFPNWSCEAPLRGAVEIQSGDDGCSSGFMARSRSDNALYVMTAGHCVDKSLATGYSWYAPYPNRSLHLIGPGWSDNFREGYGDAGIVRVTNTNWTARAWLLIKYPPTGVQEQYPILRVSGSTVGQRICRSGRSSGTSCGSVTRKGVSIAYCESTQSTGSCVTPPVYVSNLGESDAVIRPGDSGGPYFASNTALGIASGGACNSDLYCSPSYYTSASINEDALNVNISIDAG